MDYHNSETTLNKLGPRPGSDVLELLLVGRMLLPAELSRSTRTSRLLPDTKEEDVRPDGRGLGETRELILNSGIIGTADGSAMVKMGHTTVICGVKLELAAPKAESPSEGYIVPNLELGALCGPQFKSGPPTEMAQALSQSLCDVISQSGFLSLEDLCVVKGKWVWVLYCDLICLDYSGNIFDVALTSLISALRSINLPEVVYDDELDKISLNFDVKSPIKLGSIPVSTSFAIFDGLLLVDPSREEEELSQGSLRITTVEDAVCLMQKNGGATISDDRQQECLERARQNHKQIINKLQSNSMDVDR